MSDQGLFALPSLPQASAPEHVGQATGAVAEMRLVAELLERGHKVAIPVVDDDGVDLIVNYSLTVQVKSTVCTKADKQRPNSKTLLLDLARAGRKHTDPAARRPRNMLADHIDVLAVFGRDTGTWWFVPRAAIGTRKRLTFSDDPKSVFGAWRDAWEVFEG